MADLELRAGAARLIISADNGGRWAHLRVDDLDLLGRGGHRLVDWGNYPMAPYAGRIRNGKLTWQGRDHQLPRNMAPHSIHGVTLDRPWQVLDAGAAHAVLRCDLDTRWPWRGHVVQQVALQENGIRAQLELHAQDEPMPGWIGYHPWFARRLGRGQAVRTEVHCRSLFGRDQDGMPSATATPVPSPLPDGPWDDTFGDVTWPARLVWEDALEVEIRSDAQYVVVFDERPAAVCVEPQTAPPNAVEAGRAPVVDPARPHTMEMQLTWR